jgi:hypothetical protein
MEDLNREEGGPSGWRPYEKESLWKVTSTKDIKVNGTTKRYYLIEGNELSEPFKMYLRKASENEIMVYYDGQEWLHYKLFAKPGQEKWPTYGGRIGVIAAKDRVVETPAGKFSNCLEFCFYITVQGQRVPDLELYDYLAPGIGIVKRSYSWFSESDLVFAIIDGIQHGETPVKHAGRLATTWGNIKSRW